MAAGSTQDALMAGRYAAALIDMADDAKITDKVEKNIISLQSMVKESDDFRRLIENPLISRENKQKAMAALAEQAGFEKLTKNFLGILSNNRRLASLSAILRAFRTELSRRRGEVEAKVQTAFALTPAQTKSLQEQLSKAMGSHVTLDVEVNRDLLGGMVVTVGSRMIDDSVKHKLERLKRAMNSNDIATKEVV